MRLQRAIAGRTQQMVGEEEAEKTADARGKADMKEGEREKADADVTMNVLAISPGEVLKLSQEEHARLVKSGLLTDFYAKHPDLREQRKAA